MTLCFPFCGLCASVLLCSVAKMRRRFACNFSPPCVCLQATVQLMLARHPTPQGALEASLAIRSKLRGTTDDPPMTHGHQMNHHRPDSPLLHLTYGSTQACPSRPWPQVVTGADGQYVLQCGQDSRVLTGCGNRSGAGLSLCCGHV